MTKGRNRGELALQIGHGYLERPLQISYPSRTLTPKRRVRGLPPQFHSIFNV